jgi:hypothetical protein
MLLVDLVVDGKMLTVDLREAERAVVAQERNQWSGERL